jgi:hypothetical protein
MASSGHFFVVPLTLRTNILNTVLVQTTQTLDRTEENNDCLLVAGGSLLIPREAKIARLGTGKTPPRLKSISISISISLLGAETSTLRLGRVKTRVRARRGGVAYRSTNSSQTKCQACSRQTHLQINHNKRTEQTIRTSHPGLPHPLCYPPRSTTYTCSRQLRQEHRPPPQDLDLRPLI